MKVWIVTKFTSVGDDLSLTIEKVFANEASAKALVQEEEEMARTANRYYSTFVEITEREVED
jgi:hypothetical protein